jgi:Family of unknown function (DUF6093)
VRPNVAALRRHLAAMLTDAGTVTRPGEGEPTMDPETGEITYPPPTVVHDGPLLIRPTAQDSRVVESGGAVVTLRTYDVTLPAGTDVRDGDTITATTAAHGEALVGRELKVLDVPLDAWQVSRQVVAQSQS